MAISKKQMKTLAEVNFDLFQPVMVQTRPIMPIREETLPDQDNIISLPPVSWLYRMFDEFNQQFFEGRLPRAKISYSDRMLIAGSFTPVKNEIKIGRKYHRIFPDEIADTLKHEMIHIINPNHDSRFKSIAARIGASVRARSHPSLRGNYKYLYICPHCGREYPRQKRLRMAYCGICTKNGQYDARFKLRLSNSKED